jgi:hypothetical protein
MYLKYILAFVFSFGFGSYNTQSTVKLRSQIHEKKEIFYSVLCNKL